ncbi:MAG TPA: ATP-binding protein [Candidatus Peribacteria bacterium]|nr:ATP-binding protein [Candidatus Peribacteria bacterium]
MVSGLSGSGKSTIAEMLAAEGNGVTLRTDVIRDQNPELKRPEVRHTRAAAHQVYKLMMDQAREHLRAGKVVALDASFIEAEDRQLAHDLAAEMGVRLVTVLAECPDPIAEERIRARAAEGKDSASDLGVEIRHRQQRDYPVFPVPREGAEIVNTEGTRENVRERVLQLLKV